MLRWMETIPNDGLIRYLDVFNMEVVAVTTPRGAAEFLQVKADQYVKNPKVKRILENILGNGLVTSEGMDHKVCLLMTSSTMPDKTSINGNTFYLHSMSK